MRNFFLISLILAGIMSSANAQAWKIEFETGIGTYRMEKLKKFNAAFPLPFDAKLVSDFPALLIINQVFIVYSTEVALVYLLPFNQQVQKFHAKTIPVNIILVQPYMLHHFASITQNG